MSGGEEYDPDYVLEIEACMASMDPRMLEMHVGEYSGGVKAKFPSVLPRTSNGTAWYNTLT